MTWAGAAAAAADWAAPAADWTAAAAARPRPTTRPARPGRHRAPRRAAPAGCSPRVPGEVRWHTAGQN